MRNTIHNYLPKFSITKYERQILNPRRKIWLLHHRLEFWKIVSLNYRLSSFQCTLYLSWVICPTTIWYLIDVWNLWLLMRWEYNRKFQAQQQTARKTTQVFRLSHPEDITNITLATNAAKEWYIKNFNTPYTWSFNN